MKIVTGQATTERDIAAGTDFLNVPWQILNDDDSLVIEGVQAFVLITTMEEVKDFLTRKLATYKENLALHEGAKELQAGLDNSAAVAEEITNITVTEAAEGADTISADQ